MVVFILPRNLASNRDAGDIQNDIEDAIGFNVKLEHNKNWREEKSQIFNETTNKKRTILPVIHIHSDVKKANGQILTINDIPNSHSFGNGVTSTHLTLKSGEKIPVIYCVFPHANQAAVNSKLAQLKTICTQ